jgi:hypothetical protein
MSNTLVYDKATERISIPGYDYGQSEAARSPVSIQELRQIESTIGWTDDDANALGRHQDLFRNNAEKMVDAWRALIAAQPHLSEWFNGPDGKRDDQYAAKVKKRFVQWVVDACVRPHDQAWLDYQEEIGLRHTPEKKNRTDGAHTPPLVPLRYLIGFVTAIVIATRDFFVTAGIRDSELRKVEDAWLKAVQLHVVLWSRPYVKEGLW